MEDWEQFFVEKSRRRFEKDRSDRRRQRTQALLAAGAIGLVIACLIVALAVLR